VSWPMVALGEVATEARPGFASGKHDDEGVLQLRMNNLSGDGAINWEKQRRVPVPKKINELIARPGDVFFNSTNSPDLVGKTALFHGADEPVTHSNHFVRLRFKPDAADGAFISHFLQCEWQRGTFSNICKRWVNQATVSRESLLGLKIPLPPLDEQKRIAAILDKADALRRARERAADRYGALIVSRFAQAFESGSSSADYPSAPLGDLLEKIDSGWSPKCMDRPAEGDEWGVLKLSAVTSGRFSPSENKAFKGSSFPKKHLAVQQGDLLFTRKNTQELVAAVAIVDEPTERLALSDLIFRLVPRDKNRVRPVFLASALAHPNRRKSIQRLAGGAAGSMPNISKTKLREVCIPVPPIEIQLQYEGFRQRAVNSQRVSETGLIAAKSLFTSLQNRAFAGEL